MKILIGLAILAASASAFNKEFIEQMKQKMKENVESCAKEVSAGPDDVAAIFAHNIPTSHEGKCIFFCMHKMYSAQNEDGSLNLPGALETLDLVKDMDPELHTIMTETFNNCASAPADSDPCIYATNLVECIVKETKAHGLVEAIVE